MKDRTTILNAISDVLRRSSIYIAPQGTVEVERLYLLEDSVDSLVECLGRVDIQSNRVTIDAT